MTLKVVHTKDGRTLYKDLDTGHWVPKDKAVAHLKQKERDDHNRSVKQDEDLRAEQIRKHQEERDRLNGQTSSTMNFELLHRFDNRDVYIDQKSGWTIEAIRSRDDYDYNDVITTNVRDGSGNLIGNKREFIGGEERFKNEFLPKIIRDTEKAYKEKTLSTEQRYKKVLGPKKDIKSEDVPKLIDDLYRQRTINPKYKSGQKGQEYKNWHENCALCTTAVALQAQGYDVEAGPRDKTWRGSSTVFNVNYQNKDNYIIGDSKHSTSATPTVHTGKSGTKYIMGNSGIIENPPLMPKGAKAAAKAITEKVLGWGNGAVGELSISWKNSTSWHSVVVYNNNGVVTIYDSQCNKQRTDLEAFLNRTFARRTCLKRLDNAPLYNYAEDALAKMVKPVDRSSIN